MSGHGGLVSCDKRVIPFKSYFVTRSRYRSYHIQILEQGSETRIKLALYVLSRDFVKERAVERTLRYSKVTGRPE